MNQQEINQWRSLFAEFEALSRELGEEASQLWAGAISLYFKDSRGKRIRAERKARLMRASVLIAAAAFEAWTNFLASQVIEERRLASRGLTQFEVDCLSEQKRFLGQDGKEAVDKKAKFGTVSRFNLLYCVLSGDDNVPTDLYNRVKAAIDVRDALVHPKPGKIINDVAQFDTAFLGFLKADMELARVWVKASSRPPRPMLVRT